MTTNVTWRPIPGWPYRMGSNLEIWSEPRTVACKGGGTRTIRAKRIKPVAGRVWLSDAPRKQQFSVSGLFRRYFTELAYPKPQLACRNGHPLVDDGLAGELTTPKPWIFVWGHGHRICRHCLPEIPEFDDASYSGAWGVGRPPQWTRLSHVDGSPA